MPAAGAGGSEINGINVIDEAGRQGRPSDLFLPWSAANISVLAISYGAWLLDIYSSGLTLLVLGARVPQWVGVLVAIVIGFTGHWFSRRLSRPGFQRGEESPEEVHRAAR